MSEADKLIFFDLPSADPKNLAWSPNTWKTRYVLNYKCIPYRTEWVEFPDIADVCTKYGAPPTSTKADGSPYYTLPMIYDPKTRKAVVDSDAIARYLDETYPGTPPVFPPGTAALQTALLETLFPSVGEPFFFVLLGRLAPALPARSKEYFLRTREKTFGKPLDQVCVGAEREAKFEAMEKGLDKIAAWMRTNGPGKGDLLLGDKVSYVDIQIVSILIWGKIVLGESDPDWKRVASWHGGKWARMVEYYDQWATVL
ncbi:hypothetical protein EIP86_011554 [Pleurotus ostreatoroseus]|nr:hypothetical protein EIP86_011554 [Pleurotus ostreatoroseus]